MNKFLPIVIIVLVSLLGGCTTVQGRPFDASYAEKIVRGKTTKADVRKNIGEPHSTSVANGVETWSYMHQGGGGIFSGYKQVFTGVQVEMDTLMITFKGDKVLDYSYSKSR